MESFAFSPVEPESVKITVIVDVAKSVAIVQRNSSVVTEGAGIYDRSYFAYRFTQGFGCRWLNDGFFGLAIEEIGCKPAIETFARVGCE